MVKDTKNINVRVYGSRQSGVVLIVVLLLLIILSSIAMLAIKESNTGLKVTTAMQADKLMFQANDAAFVKFQTQLKQQIRDDVLPFLLSDKVKEGDQVMMCLQSNNTPSNNTPFLLNRMTHKQADGGIMQTASVTSGYCDVTNSGDYHNAGRVVTQMSLLVKGKTTAADFAITDSAIKSTNNGTDMSKAVTRCLDIDVKMTSIMPIVSNASNTKINACLQQTAQFVNVNQQSISNSTSDSASDLQCLANSSTVFMSHQQTYGVIKKETAYADSNLNSDVNSNLNPNPHLSSELEKSLQVNCLQKAEELITEDNNLVITPTNWLQLLPN